MNELLIRLGGLFRLYRSACLSGRNGDGAIAKIIIRPGTGSRRLFTTGADLPGRLLKVVARYGQESVTMPVSG